MEERLQKILSRAGVTSRRKAEELIVDGRVTVNGQVVTELGSKADLQRDHIKVNGKLIHAPDEMVYLALHKPREVITSVTDPQGRRTVMDLVPLKPRVYPVGRLDYASEGLLLMTNDGEFANRITSSRYKVPKIYLVKANGMLTDEQEEEFRRGIYLHGVRTAPAGLRLTRRAENPWYEVRLTEGRNQQIRTMFRHFGLLVEKLRRTQIGFLELKPLGPGEFRYLSESELARFRRVLKLDKAEEAKDERNSGAAAEQPNDRGRRAVQRPVPPEPRGR